MNVNAYVVHNKTIYHRPFAQAIQVVDINKSCTTQLVNMGDALYLVSNEAVIHTDMPNYMEDKEIVGFHTKHRKIMEFVNGELVIADDVDTNDVFQAESQFELLSFLCEVLYEKNKYLYSVLVKNTQNLSVRSFQNVCSSLINGLQNNKVLSMFETHVKEFGLKFLYNELGSLVETSTGKKTGILSNDQMHDLKTLKIECISMFQLMVKNGILSIDKMDDLLQAFKYLIKFKFVTSSDLNNVFSRYEDDIINKKLHLDLIFRNAIKTYFTSMDVSAEYSYHSSYMTFLQLIRMYFDSIRMIPNDVVQNYKTYNTNNVLNFHSITTRNHHIMAEARPEEFELATLRLRKLKWETPEYLMRPFKNEAELFYVGELYNNCLPTYRDRIIDNGAILIAAFKKDESKVDPDFVFEVTPRLDVLEVSTYNNEEVVDDERLSVVSAFRKAKWYLLSNSRTVYRDIDDPDEEENIA